MDGILSNPILVVRTNTNERQFLTKFIAMTAKQLGIENAIVNVDRLNYYHNINSVPLKYQLFMQCIGELREC